MPPQLQLPHATHDPVLTLAPRQNLILPGQPPEPLHEGLREHEQQQPLQAGQQEVQLVRYGTRLIKTFTNVLMHGIRNEDWCWCAYHCCSWSQNRICGKASISSSCQRVQTGEKEETGLGCEGKLAWSQPRREQGYNPSGNKKGRLQDLEESHQQTETHLNDSKKQLSTMTEELHRSQATSTSFL